MTDSPTPTPRGAQNLARMLRRAADRLDPQGAPRFTGMTMTLERGRGWVLHDFNDPNRGRGFRICYYGAAEYARAHRQAIDQNDEGLWDR